MNAIKAAVVIVVALLVLLGACVLVLANPFNWFVQKSSGFSEERFRSFSIGVRIDDVISELGPPIAVTKLEEDGPNSENLEVSYLFMGNPPPWLVAYEKAWMITDKEGIVQATYFYQEP